MLISHKYQLVFLRSRKTAGTSVEVALYHRSGPEDVATFHHWVDKHGGYGPKNTAVPPARWTVRDWGRFIIKRKRRHFHTHMPARLVRQYLGPQRWEGYFTFTTDRNPWDLAVSAYHWHHLPRYGREPQPFDSFVFSPDLGGIPTGGFTPSMTRSPWIGYSDTTS